MNILILSSESSPQLVEHMIIRLRKSGHDVVRINLSNFISESGTFHSELSLEVDDCHFSYDGHHYRLSQFDVVWSRRFRNNFVNGLISPKPYAHLPKEILPFLNTELRNISEHILQVARHRGIRIINDYKDIVTNKLSQLTLALEHALPIPHFSVVNSRQGMKGALDKYKKAITKPISGLGYLYDGDKIYGAFTEVLDPNSIENQPEFFFPSLVQEGISAVSELKCLLVGERFLAVEQVALEEAKDIDIKRAFQDRTVELRPYQLPVDFEQKLLRFAKSLQLDLCSIDVLITEDREHYFLEINQDGIVAYYAEFHSQNILELLAQYIIHGKN